MCSGVKIFTSAGAVSTGRAAFGSKISSLVGAFRAGASSPERALPVVTALSAVGILSESRAFSGTRFSGVETLLGAGFFSGPRVLSGSQVLSGVGVLFVEGAFPRLFWSSSCGEGRDGVLGGSWMP